MAKIVKLNENLANKIKFKIFKVENIDPLLDEIRTFETFINKLFNKIGDFCVKDIYNDDVDLTEYIQIVKDKKHTITNLIKLINIEYKEYIELVNTTSDIGSSFIETEHKGIVTEYNKIIHKVDEVIRLLTILKNV